MVRKVTERHDVAQLASTGAVGNRLVVVNSSVVLQGLHVHRAKKGTSSTVSQGGHSSAQALVMA